MARVTAFEAKTRFGERLERVAKGEGVVITRRDEPVARRRRRLRRCSTPSSTGPRSR